MVAWLRFVVVREMGGMILTLLAPEIFPNYENISLTFSLDESNIVD